MRYTLVMDSFSQYKDNFKSRGFFWTFGHLLYESSFLRKKISPIVNIFKPEIVMIGNNKMYIDKDDRVVSQSLISFGTWEEHETNLFKKNIKKGDVVIDVGANIGYYTLIAAELVGKNGKVFAFEPNTRNCALLKKNVEVNGYKNVEIIDKALSDFNGTGKLFLTNEDNYGDLRIFNSNDNRESVGIKLITLDSFLNKKKINVNVIKMDVQGAEVRVLKGATNTLKKNKQLKLFTEFWPKALKLSGSSQYEYADILNSNKFSIYEIDNENKSMSKTTMKKLFEKYSESGIYNADLYCIKGK